MRIINVRRNEKENVIRKVGNTVKRRPSVNWINRHCGKKNREW
jgi:hypothetical protein